MNKDVLLPAVAGLLLLSPFFAQAQSHGTGPDVNRSPAVVTADAPKFCGLNCTKEDELKGILEATNANKEIGSPLYCSGGSQGAVEAGEAAVTGARRIMAMMYGSCDVLKLPVRQLMKQPNEITGGFRKRDYKDGIPSFRREFTNKATVLAQQPYLKDRQAKSCNDKKVCSNSKLRAKLSACEQYSCGALDYPPMYQYGAKPAGEAFSIRRNYSDKFPKDYWKKSPGIDCSAYMSLSLSAMGLKTSPEMDGISGGMGSSGFMSLVNGYYIKGGKSVKGETCFDEVLDKGVPKPGDILAAKGHVAMVDTVGADPFHNGLLMDGGIKKWSELLEDSRSVLPGKLKGCDTKSLASVLTSSDQMQSNLDCVDQMVLDICHNYHNSKLRVDYDITMIHSTGNGQVGIQRERLGSAFRPVDDDGSGGALAATMVLKAETECSLRLKQELLTLANAKNELKLTAWAGDSVFTTRLAERGGELMRHRSSDPRCVMSPNDVPKVEGWECSACCDTHSSYETMTEGWDAR